MHELLEMLKRIEHKLDQLVQPLFVREWYSTAQAAEVLGKSTFTVREWCRLGRVHAEKRPCGRGTTQEWMIHARELHRIRNEGLLPSKY